MAAADAVAASASTMLMRGSSQEAARRRTPSVVANDSRRTQLDEEPFASGHTTADHCDELLAEQPI